MPISSASIPIGATYAPTGGVATTLESLGQNPGVNELHLDDSPSSLLLRETLTVTTRSPIPDAGKPNGYTQRRSTLLFKQPILLANGEYTVNTLRMELSHEPESTAAQVASLRDRAMHCSVDADFDEFWVSGAVA